MYKHLKNSDDTLNYCIFLVLANKVYQPWFYAFILKKYLAVLFYVFINLLIDILIGSL